MPSQKSIISYPGAQVTKSADRAKNSKIELSRRSTFKKPSNELVNFRSLVVSQVVEVQKLERAVTEMELDVFEAKRSLDDLKGFERISSTATTGIETTGKFKCEHNSPKEYEEKYATGQEKRAKIWVEIFILRNRKEVQNSSVIKSNPKKEAKRPKNSCEGSELKQIQSVESSAQSSATLYLEPTNSIDMPHAHDKSLQLVGLEDSPFSLSTDADDQQTTSIPETVSAFRFIPKEVMWEGDEFCASILACVSNIHEFTKEEEFEDSLEESQFPSKSDCASSRYISDEDVLMDISELFALPAVEESFKSVAINDSDRKKPISTRKARRIRKTRLLFELFDVF
ncbi:hypothetical protein HK098_007023 [Nowakowskiella sp. JEL0407]|nr:hypothetical protein HK098_007023 [Nowakowskiella sp. JEL0407]